MIEIKKNALSKLQKLEVPAFLEKVILLLERHSIDELRLNDIYELLLEQKVKSEVLTVPYGEHPLTEELDRLHKRRLKYAALINMQMRALDKADLEEMQRSVKIAKGEVKTYFAYLGQKSRLVAYNNINGFFNHLSTNIPLQDAMTSLGFQPYLHELKKTNKEHYALSKQRKESIRNRPQVDFRLVQREIQRILRLFFEQLETYQKSFKHINYESLAKDMNQLIPVYTKLIKSRAAVNKRRAKKAKAAKEAILNAKALKSESDNLLPADSPSKTQDGNEIAKTKNKSDNIIKSKSAKPNHTKRKKNTSKHVLVVASKPNKGKVGDKDEVFQNKTSQ